MCVSVASVIQHAMRMRCIVLPSVACPVRLYHIFSTLPQKGPNFLFKKIRNNVMPLLIQMVQNINLSQIRFDMINFNQLRNQQSYSFGSSKKVKVKVKAVCGSYSTAALRHIVLLPE